MEKQIPATKENVEIAINRVNGFAKERGYQIVGEFTEGSRSFESKSKDKVLRNYLWRTGKHTSMAQANKFLHFLYKKVYKFSSAPRIEYSEKELKIKESRKAWKKVQLEADTLLAAYKAEKGDFYKK